MKKLALITLTLLLFSFYNGNCQKLINKISKHPFSNPAKQDVFILSLTGRSVLAGKVTLKIIDFKGKEIYKKLYSSEDLLEDMEDVLTAKQKIDTIKSRMNHFFDENNFLKPAIGPADKYDADYNDIKSWKDIKSDKSAIGFTYTIYYESILRIAWSKRKNEVVTYFDFD